MSDKAKKTYTADEFKAICKDMVPHLNGLQEAARKNGVDGYIRVTIGPDGYINMEGGGFTGWELSRYQGDEDYTARYSYSERFTLGEEAQA